MEVLRGPDALSFDASRSTTRDAVTGSVGQRIDPADLAETSEVGIRRAHGEPVLDRQGSDLSVRDQVAAKLILADEGSQDAGMLLSGVRDPGGVSGQPLFDVPPGLCRWEGSVRRLGMVADPHEGAETQLRQPHHAHT